MNLGADSALTIAVTGVGAIIGQGIVRSLRQCRPEVRVVGIDRSDRSVGPSMCDVFVKKPRCAEDHPDYLQFWLDVLHTHQVQLVLPGLEVDVEFFNRTRAEFLAEPPIIVLNRPEVIALASDKWQLMQVLAGAGLPCIPTLADTTWEAAVAALGPPPLLMKPRHGNGSRGIVRIHDDTDHAYWSKRGIGQAILQSLIGNDDEEYTVGVFGFGDGTAVAPMIFRRRLSAAGNTVEAEVTDDPRVSVVCESLIRLLRPLGPTNFQFRIHDDQAFLFDLNARFSSSNSLRTAFGYNEPQMAIDWYVFGRKTDAPHILSGTAWRYTSDFVTYAGDTL